MLNHFHRTCWAISAVMIAAAIWTGIAQAQAEASGAKTAEAQEDDYYELMRVFVDTFQEIDRQYVKEVNRRELIEAAIRGMLSELDPYSDYINPEHLDQFNEAITQEFGGVGIRVNFDRKRRAIQVMSPLPGSPAYEAGIHSGDFITAIGDELVKDFPEELEIEHAVKLLRGKPGDAIKVTVEHANNEEVEEIELVREIIQLDTVMGFSYQEDGNWDFMLDKENKIGFIRLTHFTQRSAAEMREALLKLRKAGMQGLILDLRTNPGGLLQAAVEISDLFIEEGEIVSTKGRNIVTRPWRAKRFGTFTGFPMAILINHLSASASEIVSACLQDHKRAIIVGERSWGKGSVQNIFDLEDGESALKLTTASYHRPSGKNIHRFPNSKESDEWGVMPDDGYIVKFNADEFRAYQRDRRERDVLGREEEYTSEFVDTQLNKALDYLKEQVTSDVADKPDSEPAEGEDQPRPKQEEDKKAAFEFRFYPFPKQTVG